MYIITWDYCDFMTGKLFVFPVIKLLRTANCWFYILAYGCSSDSLEEYVRMSDTLIWECFTRFCLGIIANYAKVYLRYPTNEDIKRVVQQNATCGFPGMFGSIDCMNWRWKNCPTAWRYIICFYLVYSNVFNFDNIY